MHEDSRRNHSTDYGSYSITSEGMMSVILGHVASAHEKRGPQRAPGELEVVRRFVNTRDVEEATDVLETAATADSWLSEHRLPGAGNLDEADLERLSSVREALRELLLANNAGEAPPRTALAELNHQSSEAAIGLRFDPDGSQLVTTCEGVDSTIARLLSIVHESMGSGTWERLKACPADDCLWAFYDRSRNHSRTWCEMEDCGNRAKARAYRERRRSGRAR
jgi:predicted RNA-binding Zn ribbon-like protein